ncbi:MAG: ABC transporter permease [Verrucomicrobia bacterium]|nr:ABC transporter permease [Verrucomicrobiota bacterium]
MNRHLTVILFYLLLIIFWLTAFELNLLPSYILPSPFMVGERLHELWVDGYFLPSLAASLRRMAAGFACSVCIGLMFGLAMGTNRMLNECLKSFFLGLQTLPTVAWVPISLLIFGLKERGIYFVIVMSSTPAIAISTADGIAGIPTLYLRAAQTLGTPPYAMGWRVIFPAALPRIVTGIKLGWTLGWHGAVSAELIKASLGLGFLLHMGRELNDMPQVIGIMIVTILFGVLLDRFLFGAIEKRIQRRWGLASNH